MMDQPPIQPGAPAIEMTDVAVGAMRDPETIVAEGINWTVSAGDYWVVAGLHGAGKSDFLMLTGGLMPPARGRYRFFQYPPAKLRGPYNVVLEFVYGMARVPVFHTPSYFCLRSFGGRLIRTREECGIRQRNG